MSRQICDALFIPGRGLTPEGEATAATRIRAETAAAYYHANRNSVGLIVCSGAYSASMPNPPEGATEARSLADILFQNQVPSYLIEEDNVSADTFGNFIETARLIQDGAFEFDPEQRLGIVASRLHYLRAGQIAKRALTPNVINIPTKGETTRLELAREVAQEAVVGAALTALVLRGVEPGNIAQLEVSHGRFENIASHLNPRPQVA